MIPILKGQFFGLLVAHNTRHYTSRHIRRVFVINELHTHTFELWFGNFIDLCWGQLNIFVSVSGLRWQL